MTSHSTRQSLPRSLSVPACLCTARETPGVSLWTLLFVLRIRARTKAGHHASPAAEVLWQLCCKQQQPATPCDPGTTQQKRQMPRCPVNAAGEHFSTLTCRDQPALLCAVVRTMVTSSAAVPLQDLHARTEITQASKVMSYFTYLL